MDIKQTPEKERSTCDVTAIVGWTKPQNAVESSDVTCSCVLLCFVIIDSLMLILRTCVVISAFRSSVYCSINRAVYRGFGCEIHQYFVVFSRLFCVFLVSLLRPAFFPLCAFHMHLTAQECTSYSPKIDYSAWMKGHWRAAGGLSFRQGWRWLAQ